MLDELGERLGADGLPGAAWPGHRHGADAGLGSDHRPARKPACGPRRRPGFGAGATPNALQMSWLNSVTTRVNEVVERAARTSGATYVDVTDIMLRGDHTMCEDRAGAGVGERWINRLIPSSLEQSAHPNQYMHQAEAGRFFECCRTWQIPWATLLLPYA